MSIKQDRIGTRTAEDLRQRLNVTEIAETGEKVDASAEQVQKLSNQVDGLNNAVKNTRESYVSTNEQEFSEDQKERARINIGAVGEETDPTVPSHVKKITIQDINNWNSGTGGGGGTSVDTLPVGSIVEYDGNEVPDGYEEVSSEKVLQGVFPLIPILCNGETTGTTTIFTQYNLKQRIETLCPLKEGYTRTYTALGTINTNDNGIVIYVGGYELLRNSVWGAYGTKHGRVVSADVTDTINSLSSAHQDITLTNTKNSGNAWWYVYGVDLLIYDQKN